MEAQQELVYSNLLTCYSVLNCTVVWKITPLFASWLSSSNNLFAKHGTLSGDSSVLELGCGISGIIGITMSSFVASYTLTDQQYVMKLLNENITRNTQNSRSKLRKSTSKSNKKGTSSHDTQNISNVFTKVLDWEQDVITASFTGLPNKSSFDILIACDCIYNDALIDPLVRTCADTCKLRNTSATSPDTTIPTLVIVAQQLRSPEVFEGWLEAFHRDFRVWRMPDEELQDGMKSDSGFVVHVGILR